MKGELYMPFTTYHLASGFIIGLLLRKWLHLPTLLITTTIFVDLEPILVIMNIINDRPHGITHSFISSIPLGILSGLTIYYFEKLFKSIKSLYRSLYLVRGDEDLPNYILAGIFGWILHVMLDSLLYTDIRPFEPLISSSNPLYISNQQFLRGIYDSLLYAGLASYLGYCYYESRRIYGASLARFQLGILSILSAILLTPIGIDIEIPFSDYTSLIPLGIAILGLIILILSLREISLIDITRALLIALIISLIVISIYSKLTAANTYTIIYIGGTLILVLLRKSLTPIRLKLGRRSLRVVDIMIIGWLASILIIGIPIFILALVIMAAKSGDLTPKESNSP
jgi:hypothetical protein